LRIVFFGSPKEVISPLKSLMTFCESRQHELVAVVSQPAKPAGRKRQLTDPPLAEFAKECGLRVLQPSSARDPLFLEEFSALQPDLAITAAYGQILNEEFLAIPRRATINLHPSLLPKYRGATPVQSALLEGETRSGVSILFTVRKLDAGSLILQEKLDIGADETAQELLPRLFTLAGTLLPQAIHLLEDPSFVGAPQDEGEVTHCLKIQKSDGQIDWDSPATLIANRFRGYCPWPGSFTFFEGKRLIVQSLKISNINKDLSPGELSWDQDSKSLLAGTARGNISLIRLKPEGRKEVDAAVFWNQIKNLKNHRFTSEA